MAAEERSSNNAEEQEGGLLEVELAEVTGASIATKDQQW